MHFLGTNMGAAPAWKNPCDLVRCYLFAVLSFTPVPAAVARSRCVMSCVIVVYTQGICHVSCSELIATSGSGGEPSQPANAVVGRDAVRCVSAAKPSVCSLCLASFQHFSSNYVN